MAHALPVDGIFFQAKEENGRTVVEANIGGRVFKMFCRVFQIVDQLIGYVAAVLLALSECPGVFGNGELKVVLLGLFHEQDRALIFCA